MLEEWLLLYIWTHKSSVPSTLTQHGLVSSLTSALNFPRCSNKHISSLNAHNTQIFACSQSVSHTTGQIQRGPRRHMCLCKYVYSMCAVGCDVKSRSHRILHERSICNNQLVVKQKRESRELRDPTHPAVFLYKQWMTCTEQLLVMEANTHIYCTCTHTTIWTFYTLECWDIIYILLYIFLYQKSYNIDVLEFRASPKYLDTAVTKARISDVLTLSSF